jgi:type IV pilus assembly protein PilY1
VAGTTITNSKGKSYKYVAARPFTDSYSDTLADVAMKYWKNDLRPDLENNVPFSENNPAFWQHMVTFGVSIGLKGTLDPNADFQSIKNGSKTWPNPWRTSSNNYDSWSNESPRRIDDLWHASVNGHGAFFAATSPDEFADALKSILSNVQRILASGSNVSTSSTSLQTDTRIFHASYYSGVWSGDMAAYDISSSGVSASANWTASAGIPAYGSRKAFTWNVGTNAAATFPTTTQATAMRTGFLALNPAETAITTTQLANYIKGDQSNERSNLGVLRNRESKMGDVINSSPIYSADTDTLFVGSNDGFLHAVNATTGAERFVYSPAGLNYSDLGTIASPDYSHKYFVDGQVAVSTRKQTPGKNLLLAGLGRGGKGVFALNVTTPSTFGTGAVLWDKTVSVDNDMGYVMGEPLLAPGNNGKFLAIVPNGVGSTNNCSALFIYDLETGTQLAKLNTGACGSTTVLNGLSSPRGWDSDGNGTVDEVYAGDLMGNLWKFDLSDASAGNWKIAFAGSPLFQAKDENGKAQPISGGLSLGYELYGSRRWVLFGTGRYLATNDVLNTDTQTVYGIIDGSTTVDRDDLVERSVAVSNSGGLTIRGFETWQPLPDGKRGWALDMGDPAPGERVIERGYLAGRIFVFPSVIPTSSNACEASGRGFLNAIDAFTGTSTSVDGGNHAYFDIGNDGDTSNDWIDEDGNSSGSDGDGALPVGSVETDIGMVTKPVLVGDQLVYGGSSGGKESRKVNIPPASAKRLSWREVQAQ